MNAGWFLTYHEIPELLQNWLSGLGVRDAERGARDLIDLTRRAGTGRLDRVDRIAVQLDSVLPGCPDPGMALTNLERFLGAVRRLDETLDQLVGDARTTEILLQVFSTSQYFSEVLIRDPDLFDWLRAGAEGRERSALVEELWTTVSALATEEEQKLAFRRFRRRESLRIGYNDIVRGFPLEVITQDLSHLADACAEAAVRLARAHAEERYGVPMTPRGLPARFVVLGLGKLGGEELNFSSDIDLIFLYDDEGQTTGPKAVSNAEFFARMGSEIVRLLAEHTALGMAYRVDMRLRPDGEQGAMARSLGSTLGYYVTRGRTWERQALIKCRPVAGDLALGRTFQEAITPFVYRRYLGAAEIAEIKALKRRIEQRTVTAGTAEIEVKTGHGGIRDVEFVVQFLQLLHGGQYPEVRGGNTLHAIAQLESVGCLTADERYIMDDTYRFLRRVEHRLQIVFDRQTHEMPREMEALRTLAIRMGYAPASAWEARTGPAVRFLNDYRSKTELNRRILDHLLHDAFRADDGKAVDPIVDLVLDPDPDPGQVQQVMGAYPFRDRATAHQNLLALAREDYPFLSNARCRHFLAAIAPRLLDAVGRTPDPDMTLTNLEKVSASLGAKAVLWELFNFNPPSLRLYVELCATSQFLSEILINNPGMIDDLIDSLVVDRPSPGAAIKAELAELCAGAEDLAPILWSFRNKEWVRIGTRDILGREPVREVTRELADVAEAIVTQVARDQWRRRAERYGTPRRAVDGRRDRWAMVGLGKFGGARAELSQRPRPDLSPRGRRQDMRRARVDLQRPVRRRGRPARAPIARGQLDDRPALLRGRSTPPVRGLRPAGPEPRSVPRIPGAIDPDLGADGLHAGASHLRDRRLRHAGDRGDQGHVGGARRGGVPRLAGPGDAPPARSLPPAAPSQAAASAAWRTSSSSCAVLAARPRRAAARDLLRANLWDALEALRRREIIDVQTHAELRDAYDFLRAVEGRLRLIQNRSVGELPQTPVELERLARRLNDESAESSGSVAAFLADMEAATSRTRGHFDRIVTAAAQPQVRVP